MGVLKGIFSMKRFENGNTPLFANSWMMRAKNSVIARGVEGEQQTYYLRTVKATPRR